MKKHIILLTVAGLLASLSMDAQTVRKTFSFEARVSAGTEFYSQSYGPYYELPRTGVLLQAAVGPVVFGAGYETVFVRDAANEGALNLRLGVRFGTGQLLSGDVYLLAEKTVKSDYPMPTMSGVGTSLAIRLIGPLHLVGDFRYHYPLFASRYEVYRTRAGVVSLGLSCKF